MTLGIVKGNSLPVGMDLGSSTVKMAQLRHVDQTIELLAAASSEIPPECRQDLGQRMEFVGDSIRSIMKSGTFKSRRCVLSLPADATVVRHVRVPKLPANELPKALQYELQGKLPYAVDDAVIRHLVAGDVFGEGEAKQEVIVIAAAKSVLESCLSLARRAKLELVAINVEPCAIVECFTRLFRRSSDASRTILYLDIGALSTQVVLAHGNRIVFARNLPTGGQQLDQVVADGLKVHVEQAHAMRRDLAAGNASASAEDELLHLLGGSLDNLACELTQCLRYYESVFHNQSV